MKRKEIIAQKNEWWKDNLERTGNELLGNNLVLGNDSREPDHKGTNL